MFYGSAYTGKKGDLNNWDVSKVGTMAYTFKDSSYVGELSDWDVSSVTVLNNMFYNAKFSGDISKWNPVKCRTMNDMFRKSNILCDLSGWKMSSLDYDIASTTFSHSPLARRKKLWPTR
jgi:hypothetical protein